nr:MAG TPA: hypothetical protein [Caudoviricetes sp.]
MGTFALISHIFRDYLPNKNKQYHGISTTFIDAQCIAYGIRISISNTAIIMITKPIQPVVFSLIVLKKSKNLIRLLLPYDYPTFLSDVCVLINDQSNP